MNVMTKLQKKKYQKKYFKQYYPKHRQKIILASRIQIEKDPNGRWRNHIKRLYGITTEQYMEMFRLQNGVCAICHQPPGIFRLAVDHNHETGNFRCLACFRCNKFRIGINTVETAKRVLDMLLSNGG